MIEALLFRYHHFKDNKESPTLTRILDFFREVAQQLPAYEIDIDLVKAIASIEFDMSQNEDIEFYNIFCRKLLEAKQLLSVNHKLNTIRCPTINVRSIFEFRSNHIAQQLTLNDADVLKNIEPIELLNWLRQPNYESSPNLKIFIDKFNHISFWFQSKILKQESDKNREHFGKKMLKVLKHLLKINNFSSYICLLSALDSTCVTRLNWKPGFKAELESYTKLMDMSESFRYYREELENAKYPCIPYM